jgi:hypothetical protein
MKKLRSLLAFVLVLVALGVPAFLLWKRGTPYQPPYQSPNGEYYVQKYANLSLSSLLPGMPGHGSDAVSGYIRVYDRNGDLINERFVSFIRDVEPLWSGNKVYLRGVADMDADPWILPGTSQ